MKCCFNCDHCFEGEGWYCEACNTEPPMIKGFPSLAPDLALDGGGFQPEYFGELSRLEADNFWFRARNKLIVWAIQKHFSSFSNYLEVGCGTGYVLSGIAGEFPESKLTASEIFSAGLKYASMRVPQASFIQMDARNIPYREEFDLLGSFDVLEHIELDGLVLREMHKALKPGGGLVLTVPQHPFLWSRSDEHACHVRRYKCGELQKKVVDAGFKILFSTSFVSMLLPLMYISRLGINKKRINDNPLSELRITPPLNKAMEAIMNIDILMIKSGLKLPVGGSVLVVAQK